MSPPAIVSKEIPDIEVSLLIDTVFIRSGLNTGFDCQSIF